MWQCQSELRRAQRGAYRALAAAALAVALLTPARATAQFGLPGVPQVVYDPSAVAKLVTQLSVTRAQLEVLRQNARTLGRYNLRDVGGTLTQVDILLRDGEGLAYTLADLDGQFRGTFPGTLPEGRMTPGMAIETRRQNQRTLATLRGSLRATRASAELLSDEVARLNAIKAQLRSLGRNNAQAAAELSGVVAVHQAEELTLLRQQLATQANAQTVFMANQMNRDMQGAAAAAAFWRPGGETAVRRKSMDVSAVGFEP